MIGYRDQQVAQFVRHCARTMPYYKWLFAQAGLDPDRVRGLDDLKVLPILTKARIRENRDEFISSAVPLRQHRTIHTSGTVGGGFVFPSTIEAIQTQWAVWWRYRARHGIRRGMWCAYFGGRSIVPANEIPPPFWRYNYPSRQLMFSGYHMSDKNLPIYVEKLRRAKIEWLHGYPSLLALLANYLVTRGETLGYPLRIVTTMSENVLASQANVIEAAFGVRPRQHYGMTEAAANISECERGRLHVDEDFAGVEFFQDGPDTWRVVGTAFSNRAFGFVRYDIGDNVVPVDGVCDCGHGGRLVETIDGRQEDYVVLKDGRKLGRLDHIFKDMIRIREAQIYQRTAGEFVFRVVRCLGYSVSDEKKLLEEAHKRFGDAASISIDYVDHIARTKQGKLRFVVSDLAGARIADSQPSELIADRGE